MCPAKTRKASWLRQLRFGLPPGPDTRPTPAPEKRLQRARSWSVVLFFELSASKVAYRTGLLRSRIRRASVRRWYGERRRERPFARLALPLPPDLDVVAQELLATILIVNGAVWPLTCS